jgi:hypothetical protein
MKILFCTPAQARRYTDYLASRYGIPLSTSKKWSWIQHKENVFVVDSSWEKLANHEKGLNIFSLGLQVFSDGKTFTPTSNFITLCGEHIHQNMFDISETMVPSFFARKKLSVEGDGTPARILSDGWIVIRLRGKVIGSAEKKGRHLIPNLPNTHHAGENE